MLILFLPVPRIQFLAIETARNREGYNSELRQKFKKNKTEEPKDENKNEKPDESGDHS